MINILERFVKKLKQQMKYNDGKPLLLDDMTDKNIKTKYMGFSKLMDNPVRRIDIRFIPYSSYYYALLYFTGSGDLNKKMRQIAKKKGLKLSEYGLSDKDGNILKAKSERDIFKYLEMEYLPPNYVKSYAFSSFEAKYNISQFCQRIFTILKFLEF